MSTHPSDPRPAGRRLRADELARARPSLEELASLPRRPIVAVVENVRSLWNVGSMFRTADATRIELLLLCGFTGHPPRPEIDKTALGSVESVPWQYWTRAADACRFLRAEGYQVLALEHTTRSVPLQDLIVRPPTAFVVGNEVTGVSDEVLAIADAAFEIPMDGIKESLNVAVAFGVAAYGLSSKVDGLVG